jgi:hypothetical protein
MARLNPEAEGAERRSDLVIESADQRFVEGFRIVVERTVGEVRFDEAGDMTPYQAAFVIIGGSGEEGTFRFPHEDRGHVVVTVEHGA